MIDDFPTLKIRTDDEGRLRIGGVPVPFIEVEPLLFCPIEEGKIVKGDHFLVFRENSQGHITHLFLNNEATGAYERLTWVDDPTLHTFVLFFCLFVFSAALLFPLLAGIVRKWRKTKPKKIPELPRSELRGFRGLVTRGRLITNALTITTSGLFLLFTLLFLSLPIPPDSFLYGRIPFYVYVVFSLPLLTMLLTGLLFGLVGLTWMDRSWSKAQRVFSILVLVNCFLFLVLLNYWNLLGFHF